MRKTRLFFLIILIEGYVVLACELLAIRSMIPFVGSGTETISIIISAVLLPLAIGYHKGGDAFQRKYTKAKAKGKFVTVRGILLKNISYALLFLGLGLSYLFLEMFFSGLIHLGIKNRMAQTAIYSLVFLVSPVYMLGQTVPLVSNYFSSKNLSAITGRMLFFSTTGSFFGSVFSTIILMTFIGVHYTVIFTIILLASLVPILLINHKWDGSMARTMLAVAIVLLLNNGLVMKGMHIVSDNRYNTVEIFDDPKVPGDKYMNINRSWSSKWSNDPEKLFPYIAYREKTFLKPVENASPKKDILIIGAGGFTLGYNDLNNNYTFVDIDAKLKEDSEKYLLPGKLQANKKFVVTPARAFVHNGNEKFDVIVVDTYTNVMSVPMETVTRDFLVDVKKMLKPGAALIINMIATPDFSDKFSVRYDNTFRSVFPNYNRQVINEFTTTTAADKDKNVNALYIYFNKDADNSIYTDDKNSYSMDR